MAGFECLLSLGHPYVAPIPLTGLALLHLIRDLVALEHPYLFPTHLPGTAEPVYLSALASLFKPTAFQDGVFIV